MTNITKKLVKLFSNLCCSQCKCGFDEDAIEIKRREGGLLVAHLTCPHCEKSFGVAFVGMTNISLKDDNIEPAEVQDGPEPISYDDVIDAHRFIRNLDEHWQNHLPK